MSPQPFATVDDALAALRRVSMSELRVLLAIKSAGNVSRAAAALGVSQPSLSQHLRDIEDKLRVRLFLRHRRGLEPTPFGGVMLRLAAATRAELGIAAEELARVAGGSAPPLRVGSMSITSAGLLAVALGRFASDPTNPATILVEASREILLEHLRHQRIDLFVGRLPPDGSAEGLVSETLFYDGAVVIASARHPLARRSRIRTAELREHQWILPAEDTSFHEQLEASMRKAGLSLPPARIASYSMLAFPAIVSTSDLLGFLPTSVFGAGTLSRSLHALPVDIDWELSPIGILTRDDPTERSRCHSLLDVLRGVAASARGAVARAH
jgi:DNA-binding transcriptional LysR family regulator